MKDPKLWIRILCIVIVLALVVPLAINAFAKEAYPYDRICVEAVNLRKYPRVSANLVARISAGDPVTVTGESGDYYQLEYYGKKGYAIKMYVNGTSPTPDEALPEGTEAEVLTGVSSYPYDTVVIYQVKLRKTAADSGEVISLLPEGTEVKVLAAAADDYVKVKAEGSNGYVLRTHINYAEVPEDASLSKYTELRQGDTGEAVYCLQSALCELGYLAQEDVDGSFGEKTTAALKTMQKRNGRAQDGIATADLQMLIYEGTPKDIKGYRQYVKTVAPVEGALIRSGSTGNAVGEAQKRLQTLGYYDGEITNVCDEDTVAAIKLFEGRNGLNADGELSSGDQVQLYSSYAVPYGDNTDDVVVTVPAFTQSLKKGSEGDEVTALQNRLSELGYYSGSISGYFDGDTETAVKAFQTKNALTADGIVGQVTHTVLYGVNAAPAEETAGQDSSGENTADEGSQEEEITSEIQVIRSGSIGAAVLKLQLRLEELGYYTSRQDGMYLTDDIAAVRNFQKTNGLTVDGSAGSQTQTLLYSEDAIACTDSTSTSAEEVLKQGSIGEEVVALQKKLIELGYLSGSADGIFGSGTETALIKFQTANGLKPDGIAGTETRKVLNASTAVAADSSTSLKQGMVSDAVKDLQTKLIQLGYLSGTADGIFGTKTKLALIAFQKASGLSTDGIAASKTLSALSSAVAAASTQTQAETTTVVQSAPSVSGINASQVQYAYWYTSLRAKCKLLPNITVYDFTTGISWKLNIFSLGAHADCEPLTAEDTASMNRAFGGVTTWTPKAVWVKFSDGTVYIASTHNTPHGVQHNTSNSFSGHLCVHFPRTASQVASIGPYATSHQKAIDNGWEATVKKASSSN